jgi:hypothetical protein
LGAFLFFSHDKAKLEEKMRHLFFTMVASLFICSFTNALPIVLDDGGVHVFNDPIPMTESIDIYNNSNPPYEPTSAIFNASVGGNVNVYNDSIVFANESPITTLRLFDNSQASLVGDSGSLNFVGHDNSSLLATGAYTSEAFVLNDNANASIFGDAHFWAPTIEGNSTLTTYGLFDSNNLFGVMGNSMFTSYGVNNASIFIGDSATAILYSDEFNLPFGVYTIFGDQSWYLLDAFYANEITTSNYIGLNGGTLILAKTPAPVPEPSTIILLGTGLLGLVGLGKKKKAIKIFLNKKKPNLL